MFRPSAGKQWRRLRGKERRCGITIAAPSRNAQRPMLNVQRTMRRRREKADLSDVALAKVECRMTEVRVGTAEETANAERQTPNVERRMGRGRKRAKRKSEKGER